MAARQSHSAISLFALVPVCDSAVSSAIDLQSASPESLLAHPATDQARLTVLVKPRHYPSFFKQEVSLDEGVGGV
jgi:hypothetical protein